MKKFLKKILPQWVINLWIVRKWFDRILLYEWNKKGCPVPPPHIVKRMTIKEYKEKYGYEVLVETGTYLGTMVEAQKKRFQKIYSIELDVDLFNKAAKRFKKDKNVVILKGDSGKVLPNILLEINEPAIFWLDGHYSGGITAKGEKECPIYEELDAIFQSKKFNHILLIDDAGDFSGKGDYPTIDQLTHYIKSHNDKYQVEVKHNIIRYVV